MATCPTCGRAGYEPATRSVELIKTAAELVAALGKPGGDNRTRDVYRDKDALGYWITYGYERVSSAAIGDALGQKLIAPAYPHIPDGYWCLPNKAVEYHQSWRAHEEREALRIKRRTTP